MKSNITKIRTYNGNNSFGITKEMAKYHKEKGNEWFMMKVNDNGVVCFIPLNLFNDRLREVTEDISKV